MTIEHLSVALGTDDGLLRVEWEPGYRTWSVTARLQGVVAHDLLPDPDEPARLLVAAGSEGLLCADARLRAARRADGWFFGPACSLSLASTTGTVLAGACPAAVLRRMPAAGWSELGRFPVKDPLLKSPAVVAVTALSGDRVAAGLNDGSVWTCADGCWTEAMPGVRDEKPRLAWSSAGHLFVAASGGLWRAHCAGSGFSAEVLPPDARGQITSLIVSHGWLLVAFDGCDGLKLRPIDGWDWQPSEGLAGHVIAMAIHPCRTEAVCAATERGDLYASEDAGHTWRLLLRSLPRARCVAFLYS